VLRLDLGGEIDFGALMGRARATALGAYTHQELPFEKLVQALVPERSLARTPLFQVLFSLQNLRAQGEGLELPGLKLAPLALAGTSAKFDLTLGMVQGPFGISGSLEFSLDLFEPATAARLVEQYRRLLAAVAASPERRLTEISLLSPAELQ